MISSYKCFSFIILLLDNVYLEVRFNYHSEVGVVVLWHVLLVLAQLDRDDAAQMRTWVIPTAKKYIYLYFHDIRCQMNS